MVPIISSQQKKFGISIHFAAWMNAIGYVHYTYFHSEVERSGKILKNESKPLSLPEVPFKDSEDDHPISRVHNIITFQKDHLL
jgi:hypothetical protein